MTESGILQKQNTKMSSKKISNLKKVGSGKISKKVLVDEDMLEFFEGDSKLVQQMQKKITNITNKESKEECNHQKTFEADGMIICEGCGCEVEQELDFAPEWRWYGASDNRITRDPSRCHRSKESSKGGINKVFSDCKLEQKVALSIRNKTEQKYKTVVGDETVRGKGRKSIVAACLLYTYRDEGDIRSSDEIRQMFGLTKQDMSNGLTRYHAAFPDDRTQHIKPSEIIKRILVSAKIDFIHYKKILQIAKCLEGTNAILNRSSPQSVASAMVYLYICINPTLKASLGITKSKFARDVKLSDITIAKLVKIMGEIINTEIEI